MSRFKNQHNAKPSKGQKITGISMTIPNQAMSVREIMLKHTRGQMIEGAREEIWDGEENDLPDPRTLDISEIHERLEETQNAIQKHRDDFTEKRKAKKSKMDKEIFDKAVEEVLRPAKAPKQDEQQQPGT